MHRDVLHAAGCFVNFRTVRKGFKMITNTCTHRIYIVTYAQWNQVYKTFACPADYVTARLWKIHEFFVVAGSEFIECVPRYGSLYLWLRNVFGSRMDISKGRYALEKMHRYRVIDSIICDNTRCYLTQKMWNGHFKRFFEMLVSAKYFYRWGLLPLDFRILRYSSASPYLGSGSLHVLKINRRI